jgi:hypothetical protein
MAGDFSTNGAAHISPGQRPGYAWWFHPALKGRHNRCLTPLGWRVRGLYSRAAPTFKTGMALSLTQGALDAGGITAISQGLSESHERLPLVMKSHDAYPGVGRSRLSSA